MLVIAPEGLTKHDHLTTEQCEIFLKRHELLSKIINLSLQMQSKFIIDCLPEHMARIFS
jgi:hypothetical protein